MIGSFCAFKTSAGFWSNTGFFYKKKILICRSLNFARRLSIKSLSVQSSGGITVCEDLLLGVL